MHHLSKQWNNSIIWDPVQHKFVNMTTTTAHDNNYNHNNNNTGNNTFSGNGINSLNSHNSPYAWPNAMNGTNMNHFNHFNPYMHQSQPQQLNTNNQNPTFMIEDANSAPNRIPKLGKTVDIDLTNGVDDMDEQGDVSMKQEHKDDNNNGLDNVNESVQIEFKHDDLVDYFKDTNSLHLIGNNMESPSVLLGPIQSGKSSLCLLRNIEQFGNTVGKRCQMYTRCDSKLLKKLINYNKRITAGAAIRLVVSVRNNEQELLKLVENDDTLNVELRKVYDKFSKKYDESHGDVKQLDQLFEHSYYMSQSILFEHFGMPTSEQLKHLKARRAHMTEDMITSNLLFAKIGIRVGFGDGPTVSYDSDSDDDNDHSGDTNINNNNNNNNMKSKDTKKDLFEEYISYCFQSVWNNTKGIRERDFVSLLKSCANNVRVFMDQIVKMDGLLSAYELLCSKHFYESKDLQRIMDRLVKNEIVNEKNWKEIEHLVHLSNSQLYSFGETNSERESTARAVLFLSNGNFEFAAMCIQGCGCGRGVPLTWIMECKKYFSNHLDWV